MKTKIQKLIDRQLGPLPHEMYDQDDATMIDKIYNSIGGDLTIDEHYPLLIKELESRELLSVLIKVVYEANIFYSVAIKLIEKTLKMKWPKIVLSIAQDQTED